MKDSAVISSCGTYRYLLTRQITALPVILPKRMVFLMCNPSTADAFLDDPTIRRCKGFARRENCDEIAVVNLYALRSTDPAGLLSCDDPVGPDNDATIVKTARSAGSIVCAWGVHARPDRVNFVLTLLRAASGVELLCFGTTKDGHPRHPLMLPSAAPLQPYTPRSS